MEAIRELPAEDLIAERLSLIDGLMLVIEDSLRSGRFEEVSSLLDKVLPLLELPVRDNDGDLVHYAYNAYVNSLKGLKELVDGNLTIREFIRRLAFAELFCELSLDSIEKSINGLIQ